MLNFKSNLEEIKREKNITTLRLLKYNNFFPVSISNDHLIICQVPVDENIIGATKILFSMQLSVF